MIRKQYASLDLLKFLLIFAILLAHTGNEWAHVTGLAHYALSVYNFGVPFCFACSGYLFFSKTMRLTEEEQWAYYKKYSVRLGKMYLGWSVIYIAFTFAKWQMFGVESALVLGKIHTWIVYSTYPTIWFLPALWVGITICFLAKKKMNTFAFYVLMAVLFVVGNAMFSYGNLVKRMDFVSTFDEKYIWIFRTYRNGIFNGTPFVALGLWCATHTNRFSAKNNLCLAFFFAMVTMGECIVIKMYHLACNTDMTFFMLPSIYFLMEWALKVEMKYFSVFLWMRNLSMLIFLGQRIFLTAIPDVCMPYKAWLEGMSPLATMTVVPAMVLVFSYLVIIGSRRIKILKILW